VCWGSAGVGVDWWIWLCAEAVEGGLVAGGWRGWVVLVSGASEVSGWEWLVVGVDGWL
jgi:hypothetical protein